MNSVIESLKLTFTGSMFTLRLIAWLLVWYVLVWVPPYTVAIYMAPRYGYGWMILAVIIVVATQLILGLWYRNYCYLTDKDGFMNTSRWNL